MPKAEVGTVKWFSKQIKSKGLQKLKWYCQLCEKQCRDENGFKCHRMSDAHLRQMEVFEQNSKKMLNDYSKQFELAFMKLMKTRYSRAKVLANTVYNDMIHDRNHIHMNSTIWTTLTEFIHYLSNTNKCTIEYSDKGWYIQYNDHDGEKKDRTFDSKKKFKFTEEYKKEQRIGVAIESNSLLNQRKSINQRCPTVLLRSRGNFEENGGKISIQINNNKSSISGHNVVQNLFSSQEQDFTYNSNLEIQNRYREKYRVRSSSLSREGY
ncbi:zinc binding C-rich s with KOW domains [Cryptosporidium sp. chipmunk genotype I]|uniref:zinc binding C-rich s with KOW domains n=1 Tax=Cryptosporidium sp. chipmunk genotype I TaxID=1280935 RepID=UPI00351A5F44|nr:zinc binding C-rich s with KOW domains [Cryptosporidium sp. chipmunk genotype I]